MIGEGWKGGSVMKKVHVGRVLVGLFCVVMLISVATSLAGDMTADAGDPSNLPPGSKTLEPMPGILSDFLTVLVTVVFQTLL